MFLWTADPFPSTKPEKNSDTAVSRKVFRDGFIVVKSEEGLVPKKIPVVNRRSIEWYASSLAQPDSLYTRSRLTTLHQMQ